MPFSAARTRLLTDLPERFRFTLGKADVYEWELDTDTGALTFGSDSEIFEGIRTLQEFFEALHPDDRQAAERITESMLLKADCYRYECRLVRTPGDVRWISVNGFSQGEDGQIENVYGFTQDATSRKYAEVAAHGQRQALELAMSGAPLKEILGLLCHLVEEPSGSGLLASVMLLDADQFRLTMCVAPSIPPEYHRSIDGLAAGTSTAFCDNLTFLASSIITDTTQDELGKQFFRLMMPLGRQACWLVPLLSTKGCLQGVMPLYCREKRGPTEEETASIQLVANTASLIIERYRETEERNRAELRFRSLVNATNAIIWTTSSEVEVFTPVPEWTSFTGFTREQAEGMGWLDAIHPDDRAFMLTLIARMRQEAVSLQDEVRLRRADGEFRHMMFHAVPIVDASGAVKEWAGSYTDITERIESQQRLHHMATHDGLTGLPNRAYLNEHLEALLSFTPSDTPIAVMLIDLDRFKHINDSLGHGSGDEMLCQIAKRLQAALPIGDLVARLGGDEFVVIAHAQRGKFSVESIAKKLVETLALPVDVSDYQLFPSASIGICMYPEDGQSKDILIQNADIAMYRAKAEGGNRYGFFSEEMSIEMKKRMALEIALRGALDRGEFVLHYQPRIELPSEKLMGVEALVRWNNPECGLVLPSDFISIAEETGLIDELGIWVLRQACLDIQGLSTRLGYQLCVSVNLSPKQLLSPNLVAQVQHALDQAGMQPTCLELELTEGAFIHDMQASTLAMQQLKALGVRLAVDDFGAGHAGISYLQQFPIDVVKLDRTFITPNASEPHGHGFMKALSDMTHALGLHVVAEGVEDKATLDLLCQTQCDEAQGYFIAEPLPLSMLVTYVEKNGYPSNQLHGLT
ncbi:sensor domain-containing phosphodiesterase [Vreelandella populi]|uniref:sensor domain-containing phosphodiesterase n=1 Tax=Vreelandella populi TaxID=2498858 RepID=UPI000F8DAD52|nr:EAL domain-containing protein [Halomonas populi]RUR57275.1 EAL domain-containing protein [Halomonas populi]